MKKTPEQRNTLFRNRLAKLRKERGLSFQQLQDLTNISRSTLQRYETKDASNITIDKLNALADALNVSSAYLFGIESRDIPLSYYKNLLPLLQDLGYELIYDEETEDFFLHYGERKYSLTTEEIKSIVDTANSFIKFKLSELINTKKFSN